MEEMRQTAPMEPVWSTISAGREAQKEILDKLLKEHSQDVVQERWMKLESWFVLKAKRPGVSARALAGNMASRSFGIILSAAGWRSTNFVVGNFPPRPIFPKRP